MYTYMHMLNWLSIYFVVASQAHRSSEWFSYYDTNIVLFCVGIENWTGRVYNECSLTIYDTSDKRIAHVFALTVDNSYMNM